MISQWPKVPLDKLPYYKVQCYALGILLRCQELPMSICQLLFVGYQICYDSKLLATF